MNEAIIEDAKTAGFQVSLGRIVFNHMNRLIDVESQLTKFAQLQAARFTSPRQSNALEMAAKLYEALKYVRLDLQAQNVNRDTMQVIRDAINGYENALIPKPESDGK